DSPRPDYSRHRRAVRAAAYPSSVVDADIPDPDRGDVQPVRLHHRYLGGWFRKIADDTDAGGDAADLPRRQLLLGEHAAVELAHDYPAQSGGLSDQRLSLELL